MTDQLDEATAQALAREGEPRRYTLTVAAHLPLGRELRQPDHEGLARLGVLLSDLFGFDFVDTLAVEQAEQHPWHYFDHPAAQSPTDPQGPVQPYLDAIDAAVQDLADQAAWRAALLTRPATTQERAELASVIGVPPASLNRLEIRMSTAPDPVVHLSPASGSGLLRCCGRTPFELAGDCITVDPALATCTEHPPIGEHPVRY